MRNIFHTSHCTRRRVTHAIIFLLVITGTTPVLAQQSIGIGTTTPDSHAVLDISSTKKGVFFPRLTTGQEATLAASLTTAQTGMEITDATSGHLLLWNGSAWMTPAAAAGGTAITAETPLSVSTNNLQINAGTSAGDLLTWDGNNWINMQPAVQHFSDAVDNHQPYLVINYVIALFGIYPSQNDATEPYVGEIYMMGCNFAPTGFTFCNGALLSIATNDVLFNLLGTTYGGNGTTTFAVPDLRGRVPIHQGNNGTSTYVIGQTGGYEQMTFTR